MKKWLLLFTVSIILFACKKNNTESKPPPAPPQTFPEKIYGQWNLRETGLEGGTPNTTDTLAKHKLFFDAYTVQNIYVTNILSKDSFSLKVTDSLHSMATLTLKNGEVYTLTTPSQYQMKLTYTVGIATTYRVYARWLAD